MVLLVCLICLFLKEILFSFCSNLFRRVRRVHFSNHKWLAKIDVRGKGRHAACLSTPRMYNVSLRRVFCVVNCRHNVNATVALDT